MRQVKVSRFGIRGKVDAGLELAQVIDHVSAFASWLEGGSVVVARDTRHSSPMLASAATSALSACGCEVLDVGICPTGVAQHAALRAGAAGMVSVTASHSDGAWNGLKFYGEGGRILTKAEGAEILDLWHQGDYLKARHERLGPMRDLDNVIEDYVAALVASVDWQRIARARLRVVVDCGNGAGAMVVAALCHQLGIELIPIGCEPSGDFARPPDPTERNLANAAAIIKPVGAHVGFGFSSDCARVSLITDEGHALGTGATLPLLVDAVGRREDVGVVVASICCDSRVDRVAERRGLRVERSGIGAHAVVERMVASDAVVGGESSGRVSLRGQQAFDGLAAMVRLIERVAAERGSRALAEALPLVHVRETTIPSPLDRGYSAVARLRQQGGGRVTDMDGVRVDLPEGWYHVRVSNTEPVIRIACEARTADEADDLLRRVTRHVQAAIHE
ncbi:MAG: hypothetical protein KC503_27570 [Myxococcales bacterium]|nr:hypothetical protein [Myxococcales bacterium]